MNCLQHMVLPVVLRQPHAAARATARVPHVLDSARSCIGRNPAWGRIHGRFGVGQRRPAKITYRAACPAGSLPPPNHFPYWPRRLNRLTGPSFSGRTRGRSPPLPPGRLGAGGGRSATVPDSSPTRTAASAATSGQVAPNHLGEGDSQRPRQPQSGPSPNRQRAPGSFPLVDSGRGGPVGSGPRLFRYEDRGFRGR